MHYQNLVDARICPSKVGNDDRSGEMSRATNCPSNCTPKTISYKQIAGKYEGLYQGRGK